MINSRPMDKTEFNVRAILAGQAPQDAPVTVKGWVRTRRDSKAGISFVHLSDGSSFHPVQVVAPNTLPNYTDEVLKLTAGCAVEATGTIVPSPAKGQPFEMQASAIKVIGWVEDPDTYPIQPKPHSLEYLREVAHLRPRTNVIGAATRVRHTLAKAIHRFFDENGFSGSTRRSSPRPTRRVRARCSGCRRWISPTCRARRTARWISQGFLRPRGVPDRVGQLNVEAYCLALSKVYTFGPTFRAENSNTSRHLAEFWMIEPEIAFADLSDDATLAERSQVIFTFDGAAERAQDDLAFFDERIEKGCVAKLEGIVASEFVRMDYTEAIAVLERRQEKKEIRVPGEVGHRPAIGARALSDREAFKKPVIVMNYPKDIKAFYMRVNDDGKTVAAMDVLAPGIGEIIGGSQREERLDVLDARMAERGLDREHYAWYRDLRRYGTVPHAGFGLGFERTMAYVTGLANVRDAIPFPQNASRR
jgi:asparaginyl-tRNA synthetase